MITFCRVNSGLCKGSWDIFWEQTQRDKKNICPLHLSAIDNKEQNEMIRGLLSCVIYISVCKFQCRTEGISWKWQTLTLLGAVWATSSHHPSSPHFKTPHRAAKKKRKLVDCSCALSSGSFCKRLISSLSSFLRGGEELNESPAAARPPEGERLAGEAERCSH